MVFLVVVSSSVEDRRGGQRVRALITACQLPGHGDDRSRAALFAHRCAAQNPQWYGGGRPVPAFVSGRGPRDAPAARALSSRTRSRAGRGRIEWNAPGRWRPARAQDADATAAVAPRDEPPIVARR